MRIGVIVPVRAPAPYLPGALRSAQAQAPAEIVVVDDGSAEPLPALPEGCRVVTREQSGGPAAARDRGLAELEGCDWIALLDADDEWEPGKLDAQRQAIARHPEAAVCFGRATAVDAGGKPTGELLSEPAAGLHTAGRLVPVLFEGNPIPLSSAMVRRDALVDAGGFAGPAPLASDWDLWLRLAGRGASFVCEPRARIRYRRHPAGVTADVAALAESMLKVHEAHGSLVDEDSRRAAEARDRVLLARGHIRHRRWDEAAEALRRAQGLVPLRGRERLLGALVRVPGLRSALGRRPPYR